MAYVNELAPNKRQWIVTASHRVAAHALNDAAMTVTSFQDDDGKWVHRVRSESLGSSRDYRSCDAYSAIRNFLQEQGATLTNAEYAPLAKPTTTIHHFETSRDAYDASNHTFDADGNDGAVLTGHLFTVHSERIVGLVWTWPLAVSQECGALHTMAMGEDAADLAHDMGVPVSLFHEALTLSRGLGYGVHSSFLYTLLVDGVSVYSDD